MPIATINIRAERPADKDAIERIHLEAFSTEVEAKLVDALRETGEHLISLLAEDGHEPVGHILFSPVTLTGDEGDLRIMGLAPMAVLPSHQRRGIGMRLVERGLKRCQQDGCDAVVVLGHTDYYPRFGFCPADEYSISCEYDVPPGAFMIKELKAACLKGRQGMIKYDAAFGKL
ncbi:MAG: N-acetyltransferase [Gammaproteobacteria bacterium]|nr:N-acetyltransferase [Gammaproteobacteria bacterium]